MRLLPREPGTRMAAGHTSVPSAVPVTVGPVKPQSTRGPPGTCAGSNRRRCRSKAFAERFGLPARPRGARGEGRPSAWNRVDAWESKPGVILVDKRNRAV